MVRPQLRSRSLLRNKVITPSNTIVLHYRRKTPGVAKCSKCKCALKGIPRVRSFQLKQLPKSMKTVERPYGGNLCSQCTRALLKQKARAQ